VEQWFEDLTIQLNRPLFDSKKQIASYGDFHHRWPLWQLVGCLQGKGEAAKEQVAQQPLHPQPTPKSKGTYETRTRHKRAKRRLPLRKAAAIAAKRPNDGARRHQCHGRLKILRRCFGDTEQRLWVAPEQGATASQQDPRR
jgi:hypothetical protein